MLSKKEVKQELTIMLAQIISLLEKNGLKYSIMSGTLLGAVRHGGFIPWDDDIDIAMPRNDYNTFLQLIQNGILQVSKLEAIAYELKNDYRPYLKILNPTIVIKQNPHGQVSLCNNLWIDIFPFDYLSNIHPQTTLKKIAFYKKMLFYKIAQKEHLYRYKPGIKKIISFFICLFFKYIPIKFMNDKIISLSSTHNQGSNLIGDLTWGKDDISKCFNSSLFDELIDFNFENITVKGFKKYDSYLTQLYGNYMAIPPKENRVSHEMNAWRKNNEK